MSTKINAVCAGSASSANSVNTSFPSIVIISNHFLRVIHDSDRGNLFGGSSAVVQVQQDTGQNPSSDHYRYPIVGEQLTGSGHRIERVGQAHDTERGSRDVRHHPAFREVPEIPDVRDVAHHVDDDDGHGSDGPR